MRLSASERLVAEAAATGGDMATFIDELDRAYVEATERNPEARESLNYLIAGFPLRLNIVGRRLARQIDGALCHLRSPQDISPAFTIEVWDQAEVGSGIDGALLEKWNQAEHIAVSADGRHDLCYRATSVTHLDRRVKRVVGCVRGPDELLLNERARPFHRQLSILLNDQKIQIIHASLIDHCGKGLLFVGKGGSGKTTSSVACFLAGFGYLGDDSIGLEVTDEGRYLGHSLYATCAIERDHFSHFSELTAFGRRTKHGSEDKILVYLADYGFDRLAQRSRIVAVVIPRVIDSAETSCRRATPMEAMLSLAPSSIVGQPGSASGSLENFTKLVTTTPAFWLELGRNVSGIAPVVCQLIDELSE